MKRFLDASVLVEACLRNGPHFSSADALINEPDSVTSAHALAETYSTLSGDPRLKINPADAAQMVLDLASILSVKQFSANNYRSLISSAPAKGIRGSLLYDALHAQTARSRGVVSYTR